MRLCSTLFAIALVGLVSEPADACTWPKTDERRSGDGHYRAKFNCRQDLIDFFWNAYDFDAGDWDDGYGYGGPCDSTYPLARTFHGLYAVWYSHPDPITSGSDYGTDPLRWAGQYSRNGIDELDGRCTDGNAAAKTAMWPAPDQWTNLYRPFFYDFGPSERAGTIVHEAVHANLGWPLGEHGPDWCPRQGSCDNYFGENNANTHEVHFLEAYATRAINANYINKDLARDRANVILDTGFNTEPITRVQVFPDVPLYPDFNGDGVGDPGIFRSSSGHWYILNGKKALEGVAESLVGHVQWGLPMDEPLVGDVDGDLKNDLIVFRTHSTSLFVSDLLPGTWYVYSPHKRTVLAYGVGLGSPKAVPLVGDVNGDGAADLVVYEPNGTWSALDGRKLSTGVTQFIFTNFMWGGVGGDVPLLGLMDFDGIKDLVIFRPSDGTWWGWNIYTNRQLFGPVSYGLNTDYPLLADFDGDTRDDLGIFRPRYGQFFAQTWQGTSIFSSYSFGSLTDRPFAKGNGLTTSTDRRAGLVVFEHSTGNWYMKNPFTHASAGPIAWGYPY